MSSAYGWTPQQMAEMTIAQLYAYATDAPDMNATKLLSQPEALALAETKRRDRDRWISRVLAAVNGG